MDRISVKGIEVFAYHGVEPFEKEKGQNFILDINIYGDTCDAGRTDNLDLTVNYAEITRFALWEFQAKKFNLIEAAAENLARKLLITYPEINDVEVTVHKPEAPIEIPFDDVSVTIRRRRHNAFIAVGSNLGVSEEIIERGKKALTAGGEVKLLKESSLIVTKPYGVTDQPDFLNGMWEVSTVLSPRELLEFIHRVELGEGRERTVHWGPRTLDLDIIYYDNLVLEEKDLIIPHIDMCNREFVLKPLEEIAPYKRHPVNKKTPTEMLNSL